MRVEVGDEAPDFTLPDQSGTSWSLRAQRGTPVVMYFYPKDDTSGCTTQACDIRDHWAEFSTMGVEVVGISPDSVADHVKFADKYGLPHRLLADPERQVITAYGAWGTKKMYGREYEGVIRSSVVVSADGRIAAVFDKIRPAEQSQKALAALRELA